MNKLSQTALQTAIKSHILLGDTDLFPKLPEIDVIAKHEADFIAMATSRELNNLEIGPYRRFVVPKDDFSLRVATQFDPFDSIALTSLIVQFGDLIEKRRVPQNDKIVFSYRFALQPDGRLFSPSSDWTSFWEHCIIKAGSCQFVGYVDITDFYNQIYHHVLENQLLECGWPQYAVKYVIRLLTHLTVKVSRGIPVGPYASHLLAESSLIPIDESLLAHGIKYCRFVDDIVFFAESEIEARSNLFKIAEVLDQQQRLTINRSKTKLYSSQQFVKLFTPMVDDKPLSFAEAAVLKVINKYTQRSRYVSVAITNVSADDLRDLPDDLITEVVETYIEADEIDFVHFRWFLRRLSQIGHPGAVEVLITNFARLLPALPDIAHYFIAAGPNYKGDWKVVGGNLIELLDNQIVQSNDFLQISILSLFYQNTKLNHLSRLVEKSCAFSQDLQRELILILGAYKASPILREMKEKFPRFDPWCRRAFLTSSKALPEEERHYFAKNVHCNSTFEELLVKELKV